MEKTVAADLSLRRVFCNFLCASLLVVLARSEEDVESQVSTLSLSLRQTADVCSSSTTSAYVFTRGRSKIGWRNIWIDSREELEKIC